MENHNRQHDGGGGNVERKLRRSHVLLTVLSLAAVVTGILGVLRSNGGEAIVWPRPYDPAKPLDIYGVPGVTTEQEARAAKLIEDALEAAPRFADIEDARAAGWISIEDDMTGVEHLMNPDNFLDGRFLDPERPESLVYRSIGDERVFLAFMFVAEPQYQIGDPLLEEYAGRLMEWHRHDNICTQKVPGVPVARVLGNKDEDGNCTIPWASDTLGITLNGKEYDSGDFAMLHVWVTPHRCGPFAAVEGEAGEGVANVPREKRADLCGH